MGDFVTISILVMAVLAVAGIAVIIVRLGTRPEASAVAAMVAHIDSTAHSLESKFTTATADMAQRLEQMKGDLRQETADRLGTGFRDVTDGVEKQLSAGRQEQMASLKAEIEGLASQTRASLTEIRTEVDSKLGAIGEQVQQKLEENIQAGVAQFQQVQEHLKAAEEQLRNVGEIGESINDLNNLLKLPHLRGRFGEESLERLLEDFLPAHMYEFQASPGPGVSGRADAVIKFPERNLPIDAKFPREQVEGLFAGNDPAQLDAARVEFVRVMKEQGKRIAGYIQPENGTTDLALMYLPSETLYMEAVRSAEVNDYLHKLHVFPASPNTLIVTLKSIQMVFKMYEFAKSYEKATQELRKAQQSFGFFEKQFDEIGKSLTKAQDAFGVARRHLTIYTRRVTDLTGEPVPEVEAPGERNES
ncbi:MAG TPA: DNA recombination protein RmuC [Candidatus Binataceae bacterium]|nr:DNA recombination protein RmuC [Candidatus Binataceae bacterium]